MAPEVKKIARQYVEEQLAKMGGDTPARRRVDAAVKKVAAAIQEVRSAAAASQRKRQG